MRDRFARINSLRIHLVSAMKLFPHTDADLWGPGGCLKEEFYEGVAEP